MKHLFSILTAVFAVLVFFVSCGGSEGSGNGGSETSDGNGSGGIYGHVTDFATGEPITNAGVELIPLGWKTVTAADGSFEFHDLDAMQYTVIAQKQGYVTNRKNVRTIAGEVVNITITLLKKEE